MEGRTTEVLDLPVAPGDREQPPHMQPLWDALREVMDPEIPVSLVDLGLICDIRLDAGVVDVDLTFTATACPCMAFIRFDIEERLLQEENVSSVRVHEVWDPPWTKDRITEAGRAAMKQFGVSM